MLLLLLALWVLPFSDTGTVQEDYLLLWKDVSSKVGSDSAGVGPFHNVKQEFASGAARRKRYGYYRSNRRTDISTINFTTKLNFFSLMNQQEWELYLSAGSISTVVLFGELAKFTGNVRQPQTFADDESRTPGDLVDVRVKARHSGAYPNGGVMAAAIVLDYMHKRQISQDLQDNTTFSVSYFEDCMLPKKSTVIWPHDAWDEVSSHPFIPAEGMVIGNSTQDDYECSGDDTDKFEHGATISGFHMNIVADTKLLEYSLVRPLAICIHISTNNPTLFYYSSGLYSNSGFSLGGNLFKGCNHFVVMVDYTEAFILIHNTWGQDWGENGKMRVLRSSANSLYIVSYPILKEEAQISYIPHVYYDPIWHWHGVSHMNDHWIQNGTAVNQTFLVTCRSNSHQENGFMAANLMTQGRSATINYGISVNYRTGRILQKAVVSGKVVGRNRNRITEAMFPVNVTINVTTIRINVYHDHLVSLVNDEPIKAFSHKTNYEDINLIEGWCSEGTEINIDHLSRNTAMVPVLTTNSGDSCEDEDESEGCEEEICRNKDLDVDCELWRDYGYCEWFSLYKEYMEEWCRLACAFC